MSEDGVTKNGATDGDGASHVRVVEGDTVPITLAPKHLADLESSGLDAHTIASSGIYSESKSAPIADVLGWGWHNGGGMVLPFFDYDSRKVVLRRVKPDRPRHRVTRSKRKPVKYEQPPNTPAHPYFGPRTIREQRFDGASVIVWGEGEKKTLLLDQLGHAAIGLTGCHNFNDPQKLKDGDGLTWSQALTKYAQRFVSGKRHVLCPDSDVFTNSNVMLATRRLAGLLLDGGATSVSLVCIPGDPNDEDRGVGIDDYFVEHGIEKTRALFETTSSIAHGEDVSPIAPKDPLVKLASLAWLRPAKLDPDLRLPPRFEVRRDRSLWVEPGDARPDGDHKEIMRSVLLPVRILRQFDGEEQRIEIAWYAGGDWHTSIVDRRACKDARRVLAEMPPDTAITSNNAALVVLWLDEYMRHNEERLRTALFTSEFGWQANERCFVLDVPIGGDGALVADTEGDRGELLRALTPKGTFAAHLEALRAAFDEEPIAAISILCALSAPLLRKLGAPNFGLNLYGDSSRGKTSILKVAASTFGDPSSEQWIGSWNATAVAMELRAATLTDLPLPFDEVGAGDMRTVERAIYMLIGGTGKARGDRGVKMRKTLSWHTVPMSTGEHEVVDERANTGAQIRMLQYRVSGFGERDAAGVDALREACERNHGHVGRRWIEALVEIEDWTPYIELFEESKRQFRAKAVGSLMQRQAVYYALLAVTEHLASKAVGIGERGGATIRDFFGDEKRTREVRTASERGIETVSQWLASEPDTFPSLAYETGGSLVAETPRGTRKLNGVRHKEFVYLLPSELRARFDAVGLSFAEVVAAWCESSFVEHDPARIDTRLKWNRKRVRVIALKCTALDIEATVPDGAQVGGDFDD